MSGTISILEQLREIDRSAYIAALFAPEDKRESIASLWAFNGEVDRVRDLISEPLPGEIRLQWWRDVATGVRAEEGRQHPIGSALLDTIATYKLPTTPFDNLCEARIFDLYNDPMPLRSDLEGYLGETRSVLFQLSAQILTGEAPQNGDAAGHAGIAFGIAQILQNMALHRSRGQIFVPLDLLMIGGLDGKSFLALENAKQAGALVSLMVSLGREHLEKAEAAIANMPQAQRVAFVLLGLCVPIFKRAEKRGGAIAIDPFSVSPFTTQWYLTRYAMGL